MDIQLTKADGILTIHFDREDKKNAIPRPCISSWPMP